MHRVLQRVEAGFTAVELLIVVTIAGVVAGISVPSLTGAMQQYALNGARQTVAGPRFAWRGSLPSRQAVRCWFDSTAPDLASLESSRSSASKGSTVPLTAAQKPAIPFPIKTQGSTQTPTDGSSGYRKGASLALCRTSRSPLAVASLP